jgi:hypothetical protein
MTGSNSNINMSRLTKFYHRLRINMPIFIVLFNLSLVYIVYMLEYVMVLMTGNNYSNTYRAAYLNGYHNLFIARTDFSSKIGLALFILVNWLVFWLLMSYFRTILSDPGYLPDPMELEVQLVLKNLDHEAFNNIPVYSGCSSSGGLDDSGDLKVFKSTLADKRKKFLKSFDVFIDEGPMTSSEVIQYRNNLEKYLVTNKRMLSSSDLYMSSDSSYTDLDQNVDIFDHFKGVDLGKINLCSFCCRWKVERSHHCKQCGKCVLKMDHHCPWVANCIGFKNHKYFCLLILYGFLTSIIIFLTFWEVLLFNTINPYSLNMTALYLFTYILNFGFLCFMTYLFNANFSLILANQTVIEKAEREKFGNNKFNFYDKGKYNNFKAVFGDNPLLWFFPVCPNEKGKGMIF